MKRHSFIISAIILTMGGFFAKAIGALYKIPLTNILGASGIGLYYLVFPVYAIIISLSSGGIAVAVATEVAKCRKIRHRYNEQKILQVAVIITFLLSLVLSIITILIAKRLAELQGNINARVGYIAIAPAIILSSIIATIRGYFQGIENMVPTTVSLIIEQIVKLSLGLILAHKLSSIGINYAVLGAILGVTMSEVVAIIVITINFVLYKGQLDFNYRQLISRGRKKIKSLGFVKCVLVSICKNHLNHKVYKCYKDRHRYSAREAFLRILKIALPSTMSGLVLPIATMLDSFLIINILVKSGVSTVTATSLYGLYGGVVQSLISLPIIIVTAIATALVPALSGLLVHNDTNEITNRTNFFIKITWLVSILAVIVVFVFADGIIKFLYGDGLNSIAINEFEFAVKLLKMSSISIIYSAFLQTNTAILQVIGGAGVPFWASIIMLPIRIVLLFILIPMPGINIFGAVIANTVYLLLINIVLVWKIKRKIALKYSLYFHLLKPIIIGLLCLLVGVIMYTLTSKISNYMVAMVTVGILIVSIYVLWLYFGRVFTNREKAYFRFRRKITKKHSKP